MLTLLTPPPSSAAHWPYSAGERICIAKKKTKVAASRWTHYITRCCCFLESPQGKVLQVRGQGAGQSLT